MSERAATSPLKDTGLFGRSLTPNDEGAPDFVVAVHHFLIENGIHPASFFRFSCALTSVLTTHFDV
jgi:hypothetical protein